ncbi:hypothetical protein LPW26_04505 [Rhodopseudomonas sp. HC1]|uniref:hypothetical protein n=1 Tax=Rhodopseudomonas infernalis TaxID=2897386 RepID=UPI001EE788F6|nr:hypothetical protein [Rhodopseudomonas infernalis]MCG6203888.1 hypothetical protein [Rhodopseudomonas infernalis]
MIEVDDLIEPGLEQIVLPALPTLLRPRENPHRSLSAAMESRRERQINLPEKQPQQARKTGKHQCLPPPKTDFRSTAYVLFTDDNLRRIDCMLAVTLGKVLQQQAEPRPRELLVEDCIGHGSHDGATGQIRAPRESRHTRQIKTHLPSPLT